MPIIPVADPSDQNRTELSGARDGSSADGGWYRRLFDESLDGILLTSPDGVIHYANPAICRLLDRTQGELRAIGRPAVVDVNDPRVQAAIEERQRTGAFSGELTFIARDGRRIPVEISSFIFEDADGRRYTSMFVRDVTERARAAEQLRRSEERFRIALRDSRVMVANTDPELRFTWAYNPRVVFCRDDVTGRTISELDLLNRFSELTAVLHDVVTSARGTRRDIRVAANTDDRFYDVTAEPLRDASGLVVGATFAAADITDSKRAEARQRFLAEASEALATSLDYEETLVKVARLAVPQFADLSIVDLQRDDRVEQAALVHRDPEHEALVRSMRQRFPVASLPPSHPLMQVRTTGKPILIGELSAGIVTQSTRSDDHRALIARLGLRSAMFVPLRTQDDSLGVLSFYSTGRAFNDEDLAFAGELARRAALAIDNARLYEKVKRATTAREEVLSIVSHDLRNPLSAVAMCVATLLEEPQQSEEKRRDIYSIIADSVAWMNRLMQDLLDAGAIEAGRLSVEIEPASIAGILEAVKTQLEPEARKRAITLRTDVDPSIGLVPVDAARIRQVLGNLVGNALKFTPGGGSIVVRATRRTGDVVVSVIDTGRGIDAAQLPHVFDRYWQARRDDRTRGTGLGLAIAKGIVEAHRGRIWAESAVGEGTTVSFSLPTRGKSTAQA